MIKACFLLKSQNTNRFQHAQCAHRVGIRRVFRSFERHRNMALRSEIVDFVRLDLLDDPNQIGRIRQISVVQLEPYVSLMRILVLVVDAIGVKRRGTTLDAVHRIAFFQQEFCQIRTVLPGNARN